MIWMQATLSTWQIPIFPATTRNIQHWTTRTHTADRGGPWIRAVGHTLGIGLGLASPLSCRRCLSLSSQGHMGRHLNLPYFLWMFLFTYSFATGASPYIYTSVGLIPILGHCIVFFVLTHTPPRATVGRSPTQRAPLNHHIPAQDAGLGGRLHHVRTVDGICSYRHCLFWQD